MGLPLYIMLSHFALLLLYIFFGLSNLILRSPCISKLNNYIESYLFWNGFLRLYMELYSGLALSSVLNIHAGEDDWDSPFYWVEVSYYSARVSIYLVAMLPILFFVPLYFIKRDEWSTEEFKKMYGALLEGTRTELRKGENKGDWVMLFVPTIFFYRRLIFISSIILLRTNILALFLIQIAMI